MSLLPEPGNTTTGLMNLTFMQFLSPHFAVYLGKVSGLGGDDNAFAHDSHSTFLDSGLNFSGSLPLSAHRVRRRPHRPALEGAVFTAAALDPMGPRRTTTLATPSRTVCSSPPRARSRSNPGLVGHQLLGGGWSNKERISLVQDPQRREDSLTQQFPRLVDPGPVLARFLERFFPGLLVPTQPLNRVGYTWTVYYNFDQYL